MANKSDNTSQSKTASNHAADLVRQKINKIYHDENHEPNTQEELIEVVELQKPESKHQRYMKSLTESGKSLAEIQTAWHNYYVALNDSDKHEVWKEFYANHDKKQTTSAADTTPDPEPAKPAYSQQSNNTKAMKNKSRGQRHAHQSVSDIKRQLTASASKSAKRKLQAKQHFQSLLFGVGVGSLVVLIMLFGFFNDRFIAPFITPSKSVSATPIIIDESSTVSDGASKVIIPKINVEIPVVYDEPSIEEHAIQNALERGVVHYATTPTPGQNGNAVIFGHSSNNILNKGKYKFAFVLLSKLEKGDVFYLTHNKVRYSYRVYQKKIVSPTELGVLGASDKPATATLITCDPPGTSLNRLVVVGEQISPDPKKNTDSANQQVPTDANQPTIIPSNSPSLWQRITDLF